MDDSHSTSIEASPIALRPIIHDLVRTRFCVPGSIFLVEHVQIAPLTQSGRWQVIRLLLGDGELCIQAILGDAMHRFVHTGEIAVGTYVRVQDGQVRLRNINDSDSGDDASRQMIFLVVLDLSTVDWNESIRALYAQQNPDKGKSQSPRPSVSTPTKKSPSKSIPDRQDPRADEDDLADAFDEFEALTFPINKAAKSPSKPPTKPIALPRDWHDLQTPLKLTTLRSIPSLPYRQNWSCNILAIVASLSPVEASNLAPYRQRTARITDPSTAKQVHLTVFLDPDEFAPKVGSAVLLTGVKNHRYDGGSLKKYASDKGQGRWWFENPWELEWCDVKGIKDWWAEMEAYFASQTSDNVLKQTDI